MGWLARLAKRSVLLNFNQVERDRWVACVAASIAPGSVVLDVGAGSSPYRPLFAHCIYKTQDFTKLDTTQLLGGQGYAPIDYVCEADEIPLPGASIDVVLCTEVLEHVPEPIRVVREIGRIVKPNGRVIVTAPLGSAIHQAPYHFYGGYTPYWYRRFLGEAGFGDIVIEPNGGFYKHFAQEALRFVVLSKPGSLRGPFVAQLAWAPLWLLFAGMMGALIPICHVLDGLDRRGDFTVGYHVTALRM